MKMDRGHHPAQSHDTTVASLHEYTYTWIIHMDHTHGSYTWVGAVCQMRALFLGRSLPVSSASERARAIASCSSSENPPAPSVATRPGATTAAAAAGESVGIARPIATGADMFDCGPALTLEDGLPGGESGSSSWLTRRRAAS